MLASTSRRPHENEELNITSVSRDGRTLGINPPLKHTHISLVQILAGRTVETRAEVGLLTRNVVVQGSVNDEWTEDIPKCPEEFEPGQFAVQSCYSGRYGKEKGNDNFGSQILIHARQMNQGLVTGRISYVEVRHAGQAFSLGKSTLFTKSNEMFVVIGVFLYQTFFGNHTICHFGFRIF